MGLEGLLTMGFWGGGGLCALGVGGVGGVGSVTGIGMLPQAVAE